MRILLVTANCANAYIDIEREHRSLQRLVAEGGHSLSVLPAAEVADLRDALVTNRAENGYDVLHFSGHATREDGLILRAKGRRKAMLGGTVLGQYLKGSGVRIVVLNACCSESLLVALGDVVPVVIGATRDVRDVVARQFTGNFYGALNEGATVRVAFEAALAKGKKGSPAYLRVGHDIRLTDDQRISHPETAFAE
jgi:hypothetical protein